MGRVAIEDDTGALTLDSPIKATSSRSGISPTFIESPTDNSQTGSNSAISAPQVSYSGNGSILPDLAENLQSASILGNIVIDSLDSGYEFDWTSTGFDPLAWGQDHDAFAGIDLSMDFADTTQDHEENSTLNST